MFYRLFNATPETCIVEESFSPLRRVKTLTKRTMREDTSDELCVHVRKSPKRHQVS